jgi:dTDP-L-rhamnose 4-epimerase
LNVHILVTGGAGFIGSHTVDALVEKGHRVRILDNLHPTVHPAGRPAHLNPEAEFIEGDVRDRRSWQQGLAGVEAVYHLAAYQDYLTDFSTFIDVNAVSTALLYEMLVEQGAGRRVGKVIVAASQAVMGEGRYRCPHCFPAHGRYVYPEIRLEAQLTEGRWDHACPDCGRDLAWEASDETVVNPCNPYAISKNAQERIAVQLGRRYGIPSVVMRYSIVQGPRQSVYNAYSGAMRIFALSLLLDRQPVIFEDGRQVRDFVNIGDVVSANLMVLEDGRADGQVFNVGGGAAWTVLDFYRAMERVVGKQIEPSIAGYYRYGDTRHIFSDTARLRALGWRPRTDVEASIGQYWEFLQDQQNLPGILEYAEKHMKTLNVIRPVRSNH